MIHQLVLAAYSQRKLDRFHPAGDQRDIRCDRKCHRGHHLRAHRRDEGPQPIRLGILGLFFSIFTLIVVAVIPSKK